MKVRTVLLIFFLLGLIVFGALTKIAVTRKAQATEHRLRPK